MKAFFCPLCGETLFFRSLTCACGAQVAFDPAAASFVPAANACVNRGLIGCNWIAEPAEGGLCSACVMTEMIPGMSRAENRSLWSESEHAKRWVLANLARWGWFTAADPGPRPVFHMLSEDAGMGMTPVSMGHDDGVLTINVTEAEPAERIRRREYLGEKLRTMTAHIRHEFGHFIFGRLMKREGFPEAFRGMFGDEHADYATALDVYYRYGPPQDWQLRHVTAYAASHPLEDWAESFAHLLHLTDIVDNFAATGIAVHDLIAPEYDAYAETDAGRLVTLGINLGMALNHVNRSMGLEDIYPFVLTPTVRGKLAFVHGYMRSAC